MNQSCDKGHMNDEDRKSEIFLENVRQIPDSIRIGILTKFAQLPYKKYGIQISEALIVATIEILNANKGKMLPQNARKETRDNTPFGLDKLIKMKLNNDTMTAGFISNELEARDVVEITRRPNEKTGRIIKYTCLKSDWIW